MYTYVHVLYCVIFYWYLSCSHKANFYVIHTIDNKDSVFCLQSVKEHQLVILRFPIEV